MKTLPVLIIGGLILYAFSRRESSPIKETKLPWQPYQSPFKWPPTTTPRYINMWQIPERGKKYEDIIRNAEQEYGLPYNLLARLLHQESRYRNDIITGATTSSAGAQGIAQIVPRWHPGVDPLNPLEAIPYAAKYLASMKKRFGSWEKALAGYNWGPTALRKNINVNGENWLDFVPHETYNYVTQITADVPVNS